MDSLLQLAERCEAAEEFANLSGDHQPLWLRADEWHEIAAALRARHSQGVSDNGK